MGKKKNANEKMQAWIDGIGRMELSNQPELQCNFCGAVFKGGHDCDYQNLKRLVNKQQREIEHWKKGFENENKIAGKLQKKVERYEKALKEILHAGTFGTHIDNREVIRSTEGHIAYETLKK